MMRGLRGAAFDPFVATVLALGLAYVALAWSPSSYGRALERLGLPGEGLIAGTPREVRGDEWSLWTPYIQAAVRNDFERFNDGSLYGEDLRNYNGLPLRDWALAFKPYFWPFFLVDASTAFSAYHAFFAVAFLLGFHRLFQTWGASRAEAASAALLLFFTSYVQTWWTTLGPVLVGLPWLLVLATGSLGRWWKALGIFWVTAAWLLAHLYPPVLITLAFAGIVAVVASRPSALRPGNVIVCGVAAGLGAGVVLLYLWEPLLALRQTVFPGQRVSGGGGLPPVQWFAQLLPFLVTSDLRPFAAGNVCEASTVGTWLPLLCAFFLDRNALVARLRASDAEGRRLRTQLALLGGGVALTSLWLLFPLPPGLGAPLLWHLVPPPRMWFACGFLLFALALRLFLIAPPRVDAARLAGAALVVGLAWFVSQRVLFGAPLLESPSESLVLVPLAAVFLLRARLRAHTRAALLASAALANALAFGGFNPIQSARPIFEPRESIVTQRLDRLAARHPRGWLVVDEPKLFGAVLNGWGYRAVPHVLIGPRLDFFRALLPSLPPAELDRIFNRFLHVKLGFRDEPQLLFRDVARVPAAAFEPVEIGVRLEPELAGRYPLAGRIGTAQLHHGAAGPYVLVRGWAPFDASDAASALRIRSDLPIASARAHPVLRPGVVARTGRTELMLSGFSLRLDLDPSAPAPSKGTICVVSEDPLLGSALVSATLPEACSDLAEPRGEAAGHSQ